MKPSELIKKHYILICLLLLVGCELRGQDTLQNTFTKKRSKSIELFYLNGTVLQTNNFVRGINSLHDPIDDIQAYSIRFSWQTNGRKLWEQLYNYPVYGIGIYTANFKPSPELGNPIAVYGFFKAPIYYNKKLSISTDAAFGITFNWESFELGENPKNIAIGAEQSVYIDLGLKIDYQILNHWTIGTGVSFTHFSNGALKSPNMGINTFAPKISLAYSLQNSERFTVINEIPEYQRNNSLSVSFYTGWKNVRYNGIGIDSTMANKGVYYNVYGLSAVCNRQVGYKSKLGLGVTFGYYGAANSSITIENGELDDNDSSLREGIEISIYPSYELVINKLSLILQPGIYIHRFSYKNQTPVLYQRIGLKYTIWRNMFAGINLHAYSLYKSDYIEWNLGYTF